MPVIALPESSLSTSGSTSPERVWYYREQSLQLPRASDPRYIEIAEQNSKKIGSYSF